MAPHLLPWGWRGVVHFDTAWSESACADGHRTRASNEQREEEGRRGERRGVVQRSGILGIKCEGRRVRFKREVEYILPCRWGNAEELPGKIEQRQERVSSERGAQWDIKFGKDEEGNREEGEKACSQHRTNPQAPYGDHDNDEEASLLLNSLHIEMCKAAASLPSVYLSSEAIGELDLELCEDAVLSSPLASTSSSLSTNPCIENGRSGAAKFPAIEDNHGGNPAAASKILEKWAGEEREDVKQSIALGAGGQPVQNPTMTQTPQFSSRWNRPQDVVTQRQHREQMETAIGMRGLW